MICAPAFPASHSLITIPLHDIQRNASTACQLFILNLISPYFRPRKVQLKCSVLLAAFNELCGRVIFVVAIKLGAIYMCYHFQWHKETRTNDILLGFPSPSYTESERKLGFVDTYHMSITYIIYMCVFSEGLLWDRTDSLDIDHSIWFWSTTILRLVLQNRKVFCANCVQLNLEKNWLAASVSYAGSIGKVH